MLQHHQFFYIRADNFHMHLFQFQGKSLLFQLWSVFQTELDPYDGEKDIQHCLKNMESYLTIIHVCMSLHFYPGLINGQILKPSVHMDSQGPRDD